MCCVPHTFLCKSNGYTHQQPCIDSISCRLTHNMSAHTSHLPVLSDRDIRLFCMVWGFALSVSLLPASPTCSPLLPGWCSFFCIPLLLASPTVPSCRPCGGHTAEVSFLFPLPYARWGDDGDDGFSQLNFSMSHRTALSTHRSLVGFFCI